MAAFAHAVSLGYRYVECDVHASADGRVVVFHDASLERLTGWRRLVTETTASELGALRVAGEPIATLEEVLRTWPELRVIVELKCDRVAERLAQLLDGLHAYERVCVGSFVDARIARLRRLASGRVCASVGRRGALRLRLRSLGLPLSRPEADCAQVPLRYRGLPVVDRRFVERCHRDGLPVHVWTVNDMAVAERLLDDGTDGIITDRPTALRALLERRGAWRDD